jgi:hypothetical protein
MPIALIVLVVTLAEYANCCRLPNLRPTGSRQTAPTRSYHWRMPTRYPVYVLALMVGINFLNYMDRWVGSAVAPLIQAEFHLSDFSVGQLGSAFTRSPC